MINVEGSFRTRSTVCSTFILLQALLVFTELSGFIAMSIQLPDLTTIEA